MADYDIAVIGGGINGAAIARDAAGRGLKVLLVEQNDLGSGTSSASSKLIHGGLRYLEQRAFKLVRESLREREILLRNAPHLVRPGRFVMPLHADGRSPWLLRLGLSIYDFLARGGSLPGTRQIDLNRDPAGEPLRRSLYSAFEYSDCFTDDARLVIANAIDAEERGATVRPRTRCVRIERADEWTLVLNMRGRRAVATARILVNATGPWTAQFSEMVLRQKKRAPVRLVRGSHIVVRKLFHHDRAYVLQNTDRRIVFAIPFHHDFTLIGTTDEDFVGDLAALAATGKEIDYLCDAVNLYFRDLVSSGDVVWAFSGVRALYDNGRKAAQDVTRDDKIVLDAGMGRAPLVTLYGGKLTTHRSVAEEVMKAIGSYFTPREPWTGTAALPGGDLAGDTFEDFVARVKRDWPFLEDGQAARLAGAYGGRVGRILGSAKTPDDLGAAFGAGLTAAEVRYLMRHEWAETAEDVLWRRTKLGLVFSAAQKEALARFMAGAVGEVARA